MITIALFGAGGKMGIRLTTSIQDDPDYRLLYVEPSKAGQARLRERGVETTGPDASGPGRGGISAAGGSRQVFVRARRFRPVR